MTTSRVIILSAVLASGSISARALAADGWGPSWSFNAIQPTSSNHLTYMRTTLVPGRLPSFGTGQLFIWPGISNPTSDLIQTTLDAYSNNGNASYCKAAAGQWCAEASVFGSFGQRNGTAVAVDGDDHITIEYKLESDNKTWTQTVSSQKLGKVISTIQSSSGLLAGGGMGFATEAQGDSFSIDNQYYLCTEARLAAADPNWGSTASGGTGAQHGATGTASGPGTAKNIHTPDGGKTWLIDIITLPAMNPQGTQTPPPAYNCSTGGTTGTGGTSGSGGSGAGGAASTGGRTGSDAGVGGNASGGANSMGGATGAGGMKADAGGASGGASGTGGGGSGGRSGGDAGVGGSASGGTSSAGASGSGGSGAGSGGAVASNGGASSANGGSSTSSGNGSGGNTNGSGGAGHGGSGAAGSSTSTAGNASSGCSCNVQGAREGLGGSLVLLGLIAALARRRRR